ncbi:hypothetical protein RHMOL_Rhmol10G0305800 [Rhododendron molle]|uniref:Uncharacterized protein n=1 Tax=Rhododendron molle TaxID=49168 RepID=A0ACC0M935_RHOML|nr:hypothetical protein RHMOL_Rhmol10G0305800 [Rhododendron molle]
MTPRPTLEVYMDDLGRITNLVGYYLYLGLKLFSHVVWLVDQNQGIPCVPREYSMNYMSKLLLWSLISETMGIKFRMFFWNWWVDALSLKYLLMESMLVALMISELLSRMVTYRTFLVGVDEILY